MKRTGGLHFRCGYCLRFLAGVYFFRRYPSRLESRPKIFHRSYSTKRPTESAGALLLKLWNSRPLPRKYAVSGFPLWCARDQEEKPALSLASLEFSPPPSPATGYFYTSRSTLTRSFTYPAIQLSKQGARCFDGARNYRVFRGWLAR